MTRRRSLNGVAVAIAGSFISRNNDVKGYWGIGMLCLQAQQTRSTSVSIDVLERTISPHVPDFGDLLDFCSSLLQSQMDALRLSITWIRKLEIVVEFSQEILNSEQPRRNQEDPFRCIVRITDDLERIHEASEAGRCAPHDPSRELRSMRAEASNKPLQPIARTDRAPAER